MIKSKKIYVYLLVIALIISFQILFLPGVIRKGKTDWGTSSDLYVFGIIVDILFLGMIISWLLHFRFTRIFSCITLCLWLFLIGWRYSVGDMAGIIHVIIGIVWGVGVCLLIFFLSPAVMRKEK
jgi:hypothetical protein